MNITLTLTASPELLTVLNKIADAYNGSGQISAAAPVVKMEKIKAPQKDTPAAAVATAGLVVTAEAPETPIAREVVRALGVAKSKAGHKDAIKKKIKELGADNLGSLDASKFPEFMIWLNTL